MMTKIRPAKADLAKGLEFELQETSHHRPLDSLDTVIVRCYLESQGIEVPDDAQPDTNTIGGWLAWADQFLQAG